MRIFIPFLICLAGCSIRGLKDTPAPYPSPEEQRTILANKPHAQPARILDSLQIVSDLQYLASDTCAGRKPGTAGHAAAEERILMRLRAATDSFDNSLLQTFEGKKINGTNEGRNIVGWVKGKKYPGRFIVISAHYDHLGKTGAGTFYGADDNASGTACLLALARYYQLHPGNYSMVFAFFDREESGLEGSSDFARRFSAAKGKENVVFNLNMDMIARSDKSEIFASGLSHNPAYKYIVDEVQPKTNVKLLMGHDTGNNTDDWTNQSDHYAFYKLQVPYLYIGVEDHPDYHRPSDTWQRVNLSRYIENCNMVALMTGILDSHQ